MLLNSLLAFFQKFFINIYDKSVLLKNIDTLIFINILLLIVTSGFMSSDNIAIFAIFVIILSVIKLLTKPREKFIFNLGDLFLLIYFLLVLISVGGSSLFWLSLKGFSKSLVYLGFYVSFIHYLKDNRKNLKYIFITIALVALGESLVALKQNFLSVSEISGWQDISRLNPEEVMTRVYGALKPYNPNLFGGYLLSVLPSSLVLIFLPLINKHKKSSLIGVSISALIASSILLTGCRGAYLGLFIEVLLTMVLTYKFLKPVYKKVFVLISSFLSCLAIGAILMTASLRARVLSMFAMRNDSSNSFRFNVYNSCMDMFRDNWLLGIGVGNQNFREIYGLYMKTGFDALSAYNIYLEIAVESGIFALIAFISFVLFNLLKAFRYIYRKKNSTVIYLAIAIVSLVGMLIHGFVDTVFFRPQIQFIFWIMIGVIRVYTSNWGKYEFSR